MSLFDPDDWYTGEHGQQVEPQQAPEPPPARPKARPVPGKQPSIAQATAIEDVNRYASSRNDDIADM